MVAIIPVVVGTITLAIVVFTTLQTSATDRLAGTTDAQVIAATFYTDVQSAAWFTTASTPSPNLFPTCGTGSLLVAFEWQPPTSSAIEVSYTMAPNGTTTQFGIQEYQLSRNECQLSPLSSPVTTSLSARAAATPAPSVVATGKSCTSPATTSCTYNSWMYGWVPTTGVTSITLALSDAATTTKSLDHQCTAGITYCFSVQATPRNWLDVVTSGPPGGLTGPTVPALFLGSGTDVNACTSSNPDMIVNGQMVLDSSSPPSMTPTNGSAKNNVYANPVSYPVGDTPPYSGDLGSGSPTTVPSAYPDPLAGLPVPNFADQPSYSNLAAATAETVTSGGTSYVYVSPGTYNFQLADTANPNAVIVLLTGEYDLTQGIGAANVESGPGGTLVYVPGTASVEATSGYSLTLSPMTTGPYAGLSLWLPNETSLSLGANTYEINGIVYEPNGTWSPTGNYHMYVGTILAAGTTCSGGGNGQFNVGFTQTLTFTSTPPASGAVGNTYTVSATDSAGLTPTYSIDPMSTAGACSISGTTVTFTGPGNCLVDANQAGTSQNTSTTPPTGGYVAAPTIEQLIVVGAG